MKNLYLPLFIFCTSFLSLSGQDFLELEPNDTPETANIITLGQKVKGTLHNTNDLNDYFRLELKEGGLLQIVANQQLPGGSYFHVYVLDGETEGFPEIKTLVLPGEQHKVSFIKNY